MAFWGEALATLVHVWIQCPTAALDNATPYKLWHGCKPDVFHLQVWGSTAYVHIQKDKGIVLHMHYEKCVFIGHPDGYKARSFTTWPQSTQLSLNALISMSALQFLHPHPLHQISKPMHLAIQHLISRTFQRMILWRLLRFCILKGHLILLGTRILLCLDLDETASIVFERQGVELKFKVQV